MPRERMARGPAADQGLQYQRLCVGTFHMGRLKVLGA
jgi:hypothetical protein